MRRGKSKVESRKSKRRNHVIRIIPVVAGSSISTVDCSRPAVAGLSTLRRAFTMIELLIAIMILGLGLVMVATVFPVGLEMTRDTVEKSMGLAAAEIAVDTIKLKLPTWHDEISNIPTNVYTGGTLPVPPIRVPLVFLQTPLVIPGDPYLALRSPTATPRPTSDMGIETDANTTTLEDQIILGAAPYLGTPFYSRVDDGNTPAVLLPEFYDPVKLANPPGQSPLILHTRVVTEQSAWGGDPDPTGTVNTQITSVIPGQNVPVDYIQRASAKNPLRPVLTTEGPPQFLIPSASPNYGFARLHLTDHVYPPIRLETTYDPSVSGRPSIDRLTYFPADPKRFDSERIVAESASDQRYSWTVIQHRLAQDRRFGLTVVVTSRGDLNSSFAYQQDRRSGPLTNSQINLAAIGGPPSDDPTTTLFLPVPNTESQRNQTPTQPDLQDGLYPRPWLVALGLPPNVALPAGWKVLTDNGTNYFEIRNNQALCTAEVARLLPAGSTFVVASGAYAGQAVRVLSSSFERTEFGKAPDQQAPARLRLESLPDQLISNPVLDGQQFYIWVFPPAVVAHPQNTNDPGELGTRSPVIAVFEREVALH